MPLRVKGPIEKMGIIISALPIPQSRNRWGNALQPVKETGFPFVLALLLGGLGPGALLPTEQPRLLAEHLAHIHNGQSNVWATEQRPILGAAEPEGWQSSEKEGLAHLACTAWEITQ